MDYVDAFKHLNTNNKFNRPSPHKAILLLTIIDLIESRELTDNCIKFNDTLSKEFVKVWKNVLPDETIFLPEVYLPYWFMGSEPFWHIVPIRGKEDAVNNLRENHIKPSEAKIREYVKYAELDEDLYFLMTLQSNRKLFKKVLLENYTNLSIEKIEELSESEENFVDHSISAMNEYKKILESSKINTSVTVPESSLYEKEFYSLNDDVQIQINLEYFTFLKKHTAERALFKDICPTVFHLYERITHNPITRDNISSSFAFTFEFFLSDLKIALLNVIGSSSLIESIENAIDILKAGQNSYVSHDVLYFNKETENDNSTDNSVKEVCPIKKELFKVQNTNDRCYIINGDGQKVYADDGQIIEINQSFFRFNFKPMCLTVKAIDHVGTEWRKGNKLLVAYSDSDLYRLLNKNSDCEIEDFIVNQSFDNNCIKVNGSWYDFDGTLLGEERPEQINENNFCPKGLLNAVEQNISSPQRYLWILAIIDFVTDAKGSSCSFDNLASLMIANAWEILASKQIQHSGIDFLDECISFLIDSSKEEMSTELTIDTPRQMIYYSIKDFPISNVYEDAIDSFIEETPFTFLKTWIQSDSNTEIEEKSQSLDKSCLYSIHTGGVNPYIAINPKWKQYLVNYHDELHDYFEELFVQTLKENQ